MINIEHSIGFVFLYLPNLIQVGRQKTKKERRIKSWFKSWVPETKPIFSAGNPFKEEVGGRKKAPLSHT